MTRRFLIFECGEVKGLGDILVSVLNFAYYAHRWGRVLALDMRNFQYFGQDSHYQFFKNFNFSVPAELKITTDLKTIDSLYSHPSYHLITGQDDISMADDFAEKVVVGGRTWRCDHLYTPKHKTNPLSYSVNLKGALRKEVVSRLSDYVWTENIGVHFRHGNGEFLVDRFDSLKSCSYEREYALLKDQYVDGVTQLLRRVQGRDASVYLAGDNQAFVSELRARIPNSFVLASELPDRPYQKHLEVEKQNPKILRDAVLDLWALSSCDYLICGESLFTDFVLLNSQKLTQERTFIISSFSLESLLSNGDATRALEAVKRAVTIAPNNIKLQQYYARALSISGRDEEAQLVELNIAKLRRYNKFRPHHVRSMISHGQIEKAIDALNCAGNSWPDNAQKHALLGDLLARVSRKAEAV
jgi:hypothetical protein